MKEKIREVIVVEGRYDKNALLQVVDATVVETGGFGVFNDKEKLAFFRRLAESRGLMACRALARALCPGRWIRRYMTK